MRRLIDEALVDIVNQVGGRREEIVIGSGDDLCENTSEENGAKERRQPLLGSEGQNFAGMLRVQLGTGDNGERR